jgi:hypothetical protein
VDCQDHVTYLYFSSFFSDTKQRFLLAFFPKFCEMVGIIEQKQFSGNHYKIAKDLNFVLKTAARIVNSYKKVYFINKTMQAKLDFIQQTLKKDS